LVFLGAVAAGARLGRAGVAMFMARAGVTLAAGMALVLAIAGSLNAQNAWYGSWQDLWGSITGAPLAQAAAQHVGARPVARSTLAEVRMTTSADRRFLAERARFARQMHLRAVRGNGGQYIQVRIPGDGPAAGPQPGTVLIWLPSSYTDPAQRRRTYPVIEAFHGMPGGPRDYRSPFGASTLLGGGAAEHRIGDAIMVVPELAPEGIDTECMNGPGLTKETWITRTIPDWVIDHLRVQASPASWASLGYSMGGWCAVMATVLHPQRFGSAILLGAYYRPIFSSRWAPYTAADLPARYELLSWLRTHHPKVNLWVEVSQQDPLSGPESAQLVRTVKAPTSVTEVVLPYAGHRWEVWREVTPEALAWLGRTAAAFAPARVA
jgi:enterochelin esterase-like enzyme